MAPTTPRCISEETIASIFWAEMLIMEETNSNRRQTPKTAPLLYLFCLSTDGRSRQLLVSSHASCFCAAPFCFATPNIFLFFLCFLSFSLSPWVHLVNIIPTARALHFLKSVLFLASFALINAASLCAGAGRALLSVGYWKQEKVTTQRMSI
jgi:hypothetical protein